MAYIIHFTASEQLDILHKKFERTEALIVIHHANDAAHAGDAAHDPSCHTPQPQSTTGPLLKRHPLLMNKHSDTKCSYMLLYY